MRSGKGWRALELADVDPQTWPGTDLSWHPLREALGTRIVGMAAFTAQRAGQEVVEAHTETDGGRGHEEVYVVLRGRATFVLDGETVDAPAGTLLLVEPATHRAATAVEPNTALLALGGPPTFEPSASEWIEKARPHVRSKPARAREILDELKAARPDSVGVDIGDALYAVGRDDRAMARQLLALVLAREPGLRTVISRDPDLGSLVDELD